MLSRVKIQNFKSIGKPGVDLELKPLTFLVGPNGGGKSSILEAIVFASRQGRSSEYFRFSDLDDLHFKIQSNLLSILVDFESQEALLGSYHIWDEGQSVQQEFIPEFAPEDGSLTGDDLARRCLFNKVYPIADTRGVVPEKKSPDAATWVGRMGQHTLEILVTLPDAKYAAKRKQVAHWAAQFGMSELGASLVDRTLITGSYVDSELFNPVNLYLGSSGSRQVLPVIAQLFWMDAQSVIGVEEPEISLHPKAQIELLAMFAEAIKDDKQIIATTHSLFMMQALGYAVHKGWLDHNQIGVYHIEKKKAVGTVAKRLKVKKTGYIEGWIPSFNKVERDLLREWAKTLPRAR